MVISPFCLIMSLYGNRFLKNEQTYCGSISLTLSFFNLLCLVPESKAFSFCLILGCHDCFNIDTTKHKIIKGPKQAQFGYTVQQHVASGGEKW